MTCTEIIGLYSSVTNRGNLFCFSGLGEMKSYEEKRSRSFEDHDQKGKMGKIIAAMFFMLFL